MTSTDIELFLATLRTGSLAAAAAALGVDRTTVGRNLEALEARLHTPLFARARGGLRPTDAALRLRESAEKVLADLRALETLARATDPAVRGTVTIATTEGLAGFLVRRGLAALAGRHPELAIQLLGGNRIVNLARGEADLALRTAPTKEEGVRVRKLIGMPVALHASAAYIRRRGAPATLDAIGRDGHDVLVPCGELARLPEARVLERCATAGARPVLRSNSMPALVDAARAGAGIVPLVASWAELAELERVLALPDVAPRPLWLAVGPGQRDRAAVRVVADEVVRLAGHAS